MVPCCSFSGQKKKEKTITCCLFHTDVYTLTSFLRFFFTLNGCAYGSPLLWRPVNIVHVSSTSMRSCSRAHGSVPCQHACFLSHYYYFFLGYYFIWRAQENRGRNSMHHLENVYLGFVNLPPQLETALHADKVCVRSYAVSVAGCVAHFQFQALELHILCVVNTQSDWKNHRDPFYWNGQNPCELVRLCPFPQTVDLTCSLTQAHLVLHSSAAVNNIS